MMMSEEQKK